jgi:hypothetical protein
MCKALGSIPSTTKTKRNPKNRVNRKFKKWSFLMVYKSIKIK